MRLACIVVLAGILGAPAIRAAPAAVDATFPPALTQLITAPEHRTALLQAVRAVDSPGGPTCPTATYVTTGEIGILAPVQTNSAGRVTAGVWKESVQATGCGMSRLLNALTTVQPDGSLQTEPLLPGTTITDPRLQQDSVQYAAAGMGEMPAGCDQGGVLNTRFVGLDGQPVGTVPQPGAAPRPWTEIWTLVACSKQTDVTMHFTPDQTGTVIRADPVKP